MEESSIFVCCGMLDKNIVTVYGVCVLFWDPCTSRMGPENHEHPRYAPKLPSS